MSQFQMSLPLRRAFVSGVLAVCLTVGAVVAVVASATPPAGMAGPILSRGTVTEDVVIGNPVRKKVTRKVKRLCA